MIGYITFYKPDLKFRDYDRYREYYCGLCRTIGRRHRSAGRLSLGYDMTFLSVLLDSIYDSETGRTTFRCGLHPFRKRIARDNLWIDYAADMNVYMAWIKCLDDWNDEKKWTRGLYALILSRRAAKIEKRYPDKTAAVKSAIAELHRLEQENSRDFEAAAGCFGRAVEAIFRFGGIWEDVLGRIGFYIGKYIYLLDAYEDLEEDLEKNRYNPFRDLCREPDFQEKVRDMLLMMVSRAAEEFELLPVEENTELLENILYAGAWHRFLEIAGKKNLQKQGQIEQEGTVEVLPEQASSAGKESK